MKLAYEKLYSIESMKSVLIVLIFFFLSSRSLELFEALVVKFAWDFCELYDQEVIELWFKFKRGYFGKFYEIVLYFSDFWNWNFIRKVVFENRWKVLIVLILFFLSFFSISRAFRSSRCCVYNSRWDFCELHDQEVVELWFKFKRGYFMKLY